MMTKGSSENPPSCIPEYAAMTNPYNYTIAVHCVQDNRKVY